MVPDVDGVRKEVKQCDFIVQMKPCRYSPEVRRWERALLKEDPCWSRSEQRPNIT